MSNDVLLIALVVLACILVTPTHTADVLNVEQASHMGVAQSLVMSPTVQAHLPTLFDVTSFANGLDGSSVSMWSVDDVPSIESAPAHRSSNTTMHANRDVALIGQRLDMSRFDPRRSAAVSAVAVDDTVHRSAFGNLSRYRMDCAMHMYGGDRL
jgi:hypothetical protein